MRKLAENNYFQLIFLLFTCWKVYLTVVFFAALSLVPLASSNFLGGGLQNYLAKPWLFAWGNFDGEHYLSIAQIGYRGLEQAFFPVYPLMMKLLALPFGANATNLTTAGVVISHMSLLSALIMLFKLLRLDYPSKLIFLTLGLILVFPTSFYFVSLYNEALFLLLAITSFYFARSKKWFWASIFGVVASGTRIFGLMILPALILEAWQQKTPFKIFFWIFFIPLGLLAYMYYQGLSVGDPLAFYHLQKIVGEQHQSGVTMLPQVYFRYIKILLTTEFLNPIYQTMILEFVAGILFFLLPIYGFFQKIRLSYLVFAMLSFLLPTIQGSFSSVPRYVIILFPSFLAMAIFIANFSKWTKSAIFLLLTIWLSIETILFLRGYWVA